MTFRAELLPDGADPVLQTVDEEPLADEAEAWSAGVDFAEMLLANEGPLAAPDTTRWFVLHGRPVRLDPKVGVQADPPWSELVSKDAPETVLALAHGWIATGRRHFDVARRSLPPRAARQIFTMEAAMLLLGGGLRLNAGVRHWPATA